MNSYFDSSIFGSNMSPAGGAPRGPPPSMSSSQQMHPGSVAQMNSGLQNNSAGMRYFTPQRQHNSNAQQGTQPNLPSSGITAENINSLMQKPISELTVADIIQINRISNDPMQQQLNSIENEMNRKFQQMQNRMDILDIEKSKLEEENCVLRQTVCNIQKSLNKIDSDARNKNVIITGLPEGEIPDNRNGYALKTDEEKICWLLQKMENVPLSQQMDTMNISRIGAEKAGYNRVVKIILPSVEIRNEFLKNTSKMKECEDPWKKVYIKKDQHPVYIGENNRLRKKAAELRKKPGYENKEVKIFNGKLTVDNNEVDKNLFFH